MNNRRRNDLRELVQKRQRAYLKFCGKGQTIGEDYGDLNDRHQEGR